MSRFRKGDYVRWKNCGVQPAPIAIVERVSKITGALSCKIVETSHRDAPAIEPGVKVSLAPYECERTEYVATTHEAPAVHKAERDTCYMSKGERSLMLRALNHFIHDQHQMITAAYKLYVEGKGGPKQDRRVFEDHKQHHDKQIKAADALAERLRTEGWKKP